MKAEDVVGGSIHPPIKKSKCCDAVMSHNDTWCYCCDRPSTPKPE